LSGNELAEGDGAAISGEQRLEFLGRQTGEVLMFDLV